MWAHQQGLLRRNGDNCIAAHHFIWRYLYAIMQAAQTPTSKLRVVTPDKEGSMNMLWQQKEFAGMQQRIADGNGSRN